LKVKFATFAPYSLRLQYHFMNTNEVYILSAVRTPMGSFGGTLKDISATKLGAIAIKASVERAGISPAAVQEVLMGSVIQANLGQAPARQAAKFAGLPDTVQCTTVNKVCASDYAGSPKHTAWRCRSGGGRRHGKHEQCAFLYRKPALGQ
jgi:hypothetical protein